MPGRKILLDCETGPRDRGETWVPMTRGQTQHHTPHYQPSGSHTQPLVMARHYGGLCEDFIMAEDINDKRGRGSQRDGVWTAETGRSSQPIRARVQMVRPDSRTNQEPGAEVEYLQKTRPIVTLGGKLNI